MIAFQQGLDFGGMSQCPCRLVIEPKIDGHQYCFASIL
jgi:hypothetical protein